MRRSSFVAGSAAVTASLATAHPALADDIIRVGSTTADDGTPMLYAQHAGIFKRMGLDVQLQVLASGGAGAPAVIGGALDTSRTSLMALISAHTRNVPLKIIAPGGLYESTKLFAAMVVPKNSPIKTVADLNGKTVGTFALRDLNSLSALAWIDRNGGNSSSVHFVEISVNASVAALQAGKLDACTLLAPTLDAAVRAGDVRVIGPVWDGIANRFLISAWYATEDYIAKNPDTVRRYIAALREGAAYCIAHPNETLPLIASFENLEASDLRGTVRSSWQTNLNIAEIQPVIDLAAKYKYIEQSFPAKDLVSPIALAR
jgi:NitT/TauT family transport system substrate-binding protein